MFENNQDYSEDDDEEKSLDENDMHELEFIRRE